MAPKAQTPTDGVAWVTGASSGIGREVALGLAAAGWTVYATARSIEALDKLASEAPAGRIRPLAGDITDADAMKSAVARIEADGRPLALALLNAGIYIPVSGEALVREDFTKSFAVNVDGTLNCLLPAIDVMKARGTGQIAIVSSVAGYGGLPTSAAYGATKAALTHLAEGLKFDLDKIGILIQVVHPGFVETPATGRNPFKMPFIVPAPEAARRILRGLARTSFEIVFPRRFALILKLINLLPYGLYFPLIARGTGWR